MNPLSILFANPAVKILEQQLWADAQRRYLVEHPADQGKDLRTIARRAKATYIREVRATIHDENGKIRDKWREFKHGMSRELAAALSMVLRMSDIDWYAVEAGDELKPDAVAAPYELLKHTSAALLYQILREKIEFEELSNEALRALASYAADQKFERIIEQARSNYEGFKVGDAWFVFADLVKADSYFIGDDKHHSELAMVILCRVAAVGEEVDRKSCKTASKAWFRKVQKNRRNDRRFNPDAWEIGSEELKSWTVRPA